MGTAPAAGFPVDQSLASRRRHRVEQAIAVVASTMEDMVRRAVASDVGRFPSGRAFRVRASPPDLASQQQGFPVRAASSNEHAASASTFRVLLVYAAFAILLAIAKHGPTRLILQSAMLTTRT